MMKTVIMTKMKTTDGEYYIHRKKDEVVKEINTQTYQGRKFVGLDVVRFSGYVGVDAEIEENYFNIDHIISFKSVEIYKSDISESYEYR